MKKGLDFSKPLFSLKLGSVDANKTEPSICALQHPPNNVTCCRRLCLHALVPPRVFRGRKLPVPSQLIAIFLLKRTQVLGTLGEG
jgi:hypothetical protein